MRVLGLCILATLALGASALTVEKRSTAGGPRIFVDGEPRLPRFYYDLFTPPGKANVCSAEGLVLVQALVPGPLEIDFGTDGKISDAFTGETLGRGPRLTVDFRLGETRLFVSEERMPCYEERNSKGKAGCGKSARCAYAALRRHRPV